ncbi:MAG: hypothetical protein QM764_08645 [Chitinophagaceae bacterium]
MRRSLLFACLVVFSALTHGQIMTVGDFIKISALPEKKLTSYLGKQGYFHSDQSFSGDTLTQDYQLTAKALAHSKDSANRYAQGFFYNDKTAFSYYTTSADEYNAIMTGLKESGFHSEGTDSMSHTLYQKNDMVVRFTTRKEDTLLYYNFTVIKDMLPSPKSIAFAEDFFGYQSHENLEYVFGKSNVLKDVYYLSDTDVVRCSILFPNTNRQVVFIWKDELNRRNISHILIGNSLRNSKAAKGDNVFPENVWTSRTGLRANMSLNELVRANNADFNFFGMDSPSPGVVVPAKNGNIDFKNTGIILSCLNCAGSKLMQKEFVSAEEAIEESQRIYVLALIIMPQKDAYLTAFHK